MPHTGQFGWNGAASLKEWLAAEPYRFEFVQAVRVLEAAHAAPPGALRARGQFAFPASEVCALDKGTEDDATPPGLTVAFLSLDGAFGPLPAAYSEDRAPAERGRGQAWSEFLDLFHHRLLRLLYAIAETHRPALNAGAARRGMAAMLESVAGLGIPGLTHRLAVPDAAVVRYAGLLGRDVRSAHGLERMLADFTGLAVAVREFAGRWVGLEASQRIRLSGKFGVPAARLGSGGALGTKAWDDHAGIEICLGSPAAPLSRHDWLALLPGGARRAAVLDLTHLYVRDHCFLRLRLTVAAAAVQRSWLGSARLGHTSFLVTRPAAAPRAVVCEGATP